LNDIEVRDYMKLGFLEANQGNPFRSYEILNRITLHNRVQATHIPHQHVVRNHGQLHTTNHPGMPEAKASSSGNRASSCTGTASLKSS
jgi:hypothetical protein